MGGEGEAVKAFVGGGKAWVSAGGADDCARREGEEGGG